MNSTVGCGALDFVTPDYVARLVKQGVALKEKYLAVIPDTEEVVQYVYDYPKQHSSFIYRGDEDFVKVIDEKLDEYSTDNIHTKMIEEYLKVHSNFKKFPISFLKRRMRFFVGYSEEMMRDYLSDMYDNPESEEDGESIDTELKYYYFKTKYGYIELNL